MALGRRRMVETETMPDSEQQALAVIPTSEGGPVDAAEQQAMGSGAVDISGDDTLPMEIPDDDLQQPNFNHRNVRAVLSKPRIEMAKGPEVDDNGNVVKKGDWWFRPGKQTFALLCDFMIRGDQPDHADLEAYKGLRLSFNRFIIATGQRGQQTFLDICKAWGMDPKRPDCRMIEDVPCILSIKTNIGKDKDTGELTGFVNHNINKVIRDIDFEQAHG